MKIFWSISCLYISLTLFGVIQFELWSQVEDIYHRGGVLMDGALTAHVSRYLLVAPLYFAQDEFGVSANFLFSILCAFMIVFTAYFLMGTYQSLGYLRRSYIEVVILCIIIALSLLMHGRVIFALLAFALIIRELYFMMNKNRGLLLHLLIVLLALWMSSVSSGTFSVVYGFFVYMWVSAWGEVLVRGSVTYTCLSRIVLYSVVLCFFFALLMVFLDKNISYFGGFWNMLEHGAGKIFMNNIDVIVLLIANLLLAGCVLFWAYLRANKFRGIMIAVLLSLGGGMFGYSTLAISVIPMILLLQVFISDFFVRAYGEEA